MTVTDAVRRLVVDKDTLDICDMVTCAFLLAPHRVRCRWQLMMVRFRLQTG